MDTEQVTIIHEDGSVTIIATMTPAPAGESGERDTPGLQLIEEE
jgi:hypothetical protein